MSENPEFQVSIIGAGKVANSLAHALGNKNIAIGEIYSRRLDQAQKLSEAIPGASAVDSLDFSPSKSSLFLIAVKDDAISEIARQIRIPKGRYIAHTSGTVSMHDLSDVGDHFGIFYPLQTFSSDQSVDFSEIPLLIDGNNQKTTDMLMRIGNSISQNVSIASEQDRQQLHVAAVFASNYTNRMLAASEEILKDTNLALDVLKPLVKQTIDNVFEQGPDQALTGPAVRNDQSTINKHLDMLNGFPQWQEVYKLLTEQIIKNSK